MFHNKTVQEVRSLLRKIFSAAAIDSPDTTARLFLQHALQVESSDLLLSSQRRLSQEEAKRVESYAKRRCNREPLARILERKEFYNLLFSLSRSCLIPRPDTECLIEVALELSATREVGSVLDLGVGPGTLLLSFLVHRPFWKGIGVDMQENSLRAAIENAKSFGVSNRCHWVVSNWVAPLLGEFNLILTNPPYISLAEYPSLEPEVREYEPRLALDGGRDGLQAYEALATSVGRHLSADGFLVIEIGWKQEKQVCSLFEACGFLYCRTQLDLSSIPRALVFQKKKQTVR